MSDKMKTIPFRKLLFWIFNEYKKYNSIFNIPSHGFVNYNSDLRFKLLNEQIDSPIGPAAGPHTQMAQNIICSYICGGRFFELKTVQALDELEIEKPCIYAADEGYNTEWSQELKLSSSFDEYLKAWFLLHFLKELFPFSTNDKNGFIFNMSVGYDLKGIKSNAIDKFIDDLLDCSNNVLFEKYKTELLTLLDNEIFISLFPITSAQKNSIENLKNKIKNISPQVSNSVTLSTMHGCPPDEIESIIKYLIKEKGLHTYIKLNPTLLGYETVKEILSIQGYAYIALNENAFSNDLQFDDCIPMLKRLMNFSKTYNRFFGIKLTNTLGVFNNSNNLPGEEMYLSGRVLFPVTINLASKIVKEFNGNISISYSGGASIFNIKELVQTGISPVTLVTDLLKPGGYMRLSQISNLINSDVDNYNHSSKIDLEKLDKLAKDSLKQNFYKKEFKETETVSINKTLPIIDCYVAPCSLACPIYQDVAEYIHHIKEGNYIKAIEVITDKNPLPNITGYICDHQCETKCTRWEYDKPVHIRELKKIAAEKGLDAFINKVNKKILRTNAKVAIIGAGPSGLAAAYFLSKAGVKVTVFEKTDKAGGNVSHVIPYFRLPYSVIEKDVEFIEKFGVTFQYIVDPDFIISDLHKNGYEFVYIAIGAGVSKKLQLNDKNKNILGAIKFLKEFNENKVTRIGKNIAVIGGGNSAMDAARAAKRLAGVENVYIIYRRTKEYMPADMEEFYGAIKDGVKFKELLQPLSYDKGILKCQRMELSNMDSDGRRNVVPVINDYFNISIDIIIGAVGEQVDENVLQKNELLKNGKIIINDSTLETDKTNAYIGGDAYRGPSTVVEAIADGTRAANSILNKLDLSQKYTSRTISRNKINNKLSKIEGKVFKEDTIEERIMAERCLSCNYKCNKCVEVCPNRANIIITSPNAEVYKDSHQIIHIDDLCNECGNCTTFCPYNGSPYEDKLTLFSNQSEFLNSKNDGFYFSSNGNVESILHLRYESKVLKLKLDKNGKIIERDSAYEKITNIIDQPTTNYKYLLDITYKE